MNESQIDTFIKEIQEEMETLRGMRNAPVSLTSSQEEKIKKLPKAKREEKKKAYLKEARQARRERMMLLLTAIENKIKSSDLPPEAKEALEKIIGQAKDNDWKISPQEIEKIEIIKEKEMAEKENVIKRETKENVTVAGAVLTGAAVGVVAGAVAAKLPEPAPVLTADTKTIQNVGGVSMLPDNKENMDPVYVKKAMTVGKKALAKMKMPKNKISIEAIKNDTSLLPIQKRYAEAVAMELRPDIKQDKLTEDCTIKTIAIKKAQERYKRKHEKRKGRTVQGTQKRPNWTKEEALVMKRVNHIKQSAGTLLSMEEIKQRLGHPTLIRIYEARMRKDHPEYFAEQDKHAQKQEQIAKLRAIRNKYRKTQTPGLLETLKNAQEKTPGNLLADTLKSMQEKPRRKTTIQAAIRNSHQYVA